MKLSPRMQAFVTALARHYDFDLTRAENHLRLELDGFLPLVIEKIGPELLSLAHYYKLNGDLVATPDVVFYTGGSQGWLAIEISQPLDYTRYAYVEEGVLVEVNEGQGQDQEDLAAFVEEWAALLYGQSWLTGANRAGKPY